MLEGRSRLFALITNTLAKDKQIENDWRHFARPISSRNLANQVEDEVVDALIAAVREAYPRLSHRYYAVKARWLGLERLEYWDRNAPLPEDSDRRVPWPEAKVVVLDAYRALLAAARRDPRPLLRRQLDRCRAAAGQGLRRVLPPDGAERAPLRADELPGPRARRDDARA